MCTKWWNDGDVHKYFSPYESPYEAFIAYMNVMQDMRLRLAEAKKKQDHEVLLNKIRPLRFSEQ
jgi:alpha-amylase